MGVGGVVSLLEALWSNLPQDRYPCLQFGISGELLWPFLLGILAFEAPDVSECILNHKHIREHRFMAFLPPYLFLFNLHHLERTSWKQTLVLYEVMLRGIALSEPRHSMANPLGIKSCRRLF